MLTLATVSKPGSGAWRLLANSGDSCRRRVRVAMIDLGGLRPSPIGVCVFLF